MGNGFLGIFLRDAHALAVVCMAADRRVDRSLRIAQMPNHYRLVYPLYRVLLDCLASP